MDVATGLAKFLPLEPLGIRLLPFDFLWVEREDHPRFREGIAFELAARIRDRTQGSAALGAGRPSGLGARRPRVLRPVNPERVATRHGTHGRARRPRRAAPTGTTSGTTRVRGPPGTSAPTNRHTHHAHTMPAPMRAMSTHHAHAMPAPCTRTMIPMVGRDVPGAPRPRGQHRERHMDARRPHRVPRLGRTPVQPGAEGASAVRASARTASRSTSFAFVLRMKPPGCAKSA